MNELQGGHAPTRNDLGFIEHLTLINSVDVHLKVNVLICHFFPVEQSSRFWSLLHHKRAKQNSLNWQIHFSHVPELDRLVRQEVNKEFRDYQEKIEAVANQKMESAIQEQLHRLEAENLKATLLKDIQVEKQALLALKKELNEQKEQIKADRKREIVERYGILIANIVCLF